jgi:hypothetical protein
MNIMQKLKSKAAQILTDPNGENIALGIQSLAKAAVLRGRLGANGNVSQEWQDYMRSFTTDPDELRRLCGQDNNFGEPIQQLNLAYVLANGMCGGATGTRTFLNVDPSIDEPPA